MEIGRIRIGDGACESDWFEGIEEIIGFDERDDVLRMLLCKSFVVFVGATVEASASVEEGRKVWLCGGGAVETEENIDGWEARGDGDGNGSKGRSLADMEAVGDGDKLASLFRRACIVVKLDKVGADSWTVAAGRRVNDAAVSIASDGIAVIVETALIGFVGEEFFEEAGFSR